MDNWNDIKTAPYNEPVRVRLGEGMSIVARLVPDASMSSEDTSCDQWQAEHEGEHPECWTDGACWESNADECLSLQPTGWLPLDPRQSQEPLLEVLREAREALDAVIPTAHFGETAQAKQFFSAPRDTLTKLDTILSGDNT